MVVYMSNYSESTAICTSTHCARCVQGTSSHRLEFLIGDRVLPYNMTVYQAVKQHSAALTSGGGMDGGAGSETDTDGEHPYAQAGVWIHTHTIWLVTSHCGNTSAWENLC